MLEAFSHHPEIGADIASLRQRFAATAAWSSAEQAGVAGADDATLEALRDGNVRYREKFGYVFLVCATGKTAAEMLALLRARLAQRSGHRAADRRRRTGEDHPPAPGEARRHEPDHVARARHGAGPAGGRAAGPARRARRRRARPHRRRARHQRPGPHHRFRAARHARRADVSADVRHRRLLRRRPAARSSTPTSTSSSPWSMPTSTTTSRCSSAPSATPPTEAHDAPRRRQGPSRRARRRQPRVHAGVSGRPRGAAAGPHRLRRRAAVQGRDHVAPRRGGARDDGHLRPHAGRLRPRRRLHRPIPTAGWRRPSTSGCGASSNASRSRTSASTSRMASAPGPDAEEDATAISRRARGRAGHAGRRAAAVHRHPHQVDRRGVEGAQRAHARDLPGHAARRDRRPPARQLRGHAAQGHGRRAAADAGAAVRDPRAPARPGGRHAAAAS